MFLDKQLSLFKNFLTLRQAIATDFSKISLVNLKICFNWRIITLQWASLVAQLIKNPPAMRETWVGSLGWEDPLEKGKATHSSILVWRIP